MSRAKSIRVYVAYADRHGAGGRLGRLMQFDEVAAGVDDERRLMGETKRLRRFRDLETAPPQLGDDGVEAGHLQGEVRS